jgi:hypothetical protein
MMKNKIFLYSLTSLAVTASALAHADEGVYVPTLEGGLTASVGTFYVTPTSDFQAYTTFRNGKFNSVENVDPGYQFGIDASLGYIFEETANSIELFWRNISTSDTGSATATVPASFPNGDGVLSGDLGYELESFDLMFSQFVNLGEVMQLRLLGGLAYVDLENNETAVFYPNDSRENNQTVQSQSKFEGWGPRVGIDTRYGFGDDIEGLGIVGGGSMAYYLGDMDISAGGSKANDVENNPGNHAVLNFRANLGLDYVYFIDNDEGSTLGLELGYLIDYYDDGVATIGFNNSLFAEAQTYVASAGGGTATSSLSFAGPYLNLKGVF